MRRLLTVLWLGTCAACATGAKTPWSFEPAAGRAPPLVQPPPEHGAGGPLIDESSEPVLGGLEEESVEELGGVSAWAPGSPRELTLQWPLPATGVTSLFGHRDDPFDGRRRFHYGIDLEAGYGAVVSAAASGRVVFAGWNHGHGRQVVLSHAGGYQTGYSHLAQVLIPEGAYVEAGQPIAFVGTSGRSTGPHLHFEITRWGDHLDPLNLLGIPLALQ